MPHNSARHALVHHLILSGVVRDGHAPSLAALAEAASVTPAEVEASLQRLAEGHALVLHPGTTEVWIAHPFSLSPTAVWVAADDGRGWWAPCLWYGNHLARDWRKWTIPEAQAIFERVRLTGPFWQLPAAGGRF